MGIIFTLLTTTMRLEGVDVASDVDEVMVAASNVVGRKWDGAATKLLLHAARHSLSRSPSHATCFPASWTQLGKLEESPSAPQPRLLEASHAPPCFVRLFPATDVAV
ncbi:hypothetical protein Droror1_Dr00000474 [Drosera rotundifolia]